MTVAYKLFNNLYQVEIPEAYVYSYEDVKNYGTRLSSDPYVNATLGEQKRCVYLSVMAENRRCLLDVFKEGGMISLSAADARKIYDLICDHLYSFMHPKVAIPVERIPIDDLIDIDSFAEAIYFWYLKDIREVNHTTMEAKLFFASTLHRSGVGGEKVSIPIRHGHKQFFLKTKIGMGQNYDRT
jgi:hypothetical protein